MVLVLIVQLTLLLLIELENRLRRWLHHRIIPREDLFNVVPESVYLDWPVQSVEDRDESPDEEVNTWKGYAEEYEDYTLSQYISQFVRCTIFAEDYSLCEIEEVDLL